MPKRLQAPHCHEAPDHGLASHAGWKRLRLPTLLAVICALLTTAAAVGQPSPGSTALIQQQRLIDEKLAQDRTRLGASPAIIDWQWGGWIEYYYFNFDDGVQESRQLSRPSLVWWTRLALDNNAHEFFARLRLRYTHFEHGDEYLRRSDWAGPQFDRLWYNLDVMKAFRLGDPSGPLQLKTRIGRQSVVFGTGYALDLPLEAITIVADVDKIRATALIGRTIRSYPNIDRSDAVDSRSARDMLGIQVEYTGFEKHVPFAYVLWNNDKTDERPRDPLQNYSYDTMYTGFGARGSIVHNWNYWAEGVIECGHSFGDGMFLRRNDVNAYAWDIGTDYLFDHRTRPRIGIEYMFASGDGDRRFSATNARGGNRGDREDTAFNAFGYRDTGLALGPALSNLHILKFGGSFQPLNKFELFRDFELGTNWFLYHRNREDGAISDFTAGNRGHGWIGWEMDYFVNWRLSSDVAWTLRWGTFFPGSAYDNDDERHMLFTGITWSY